MLKRTGALLAGAGLALAVASTSWAGDVYIFPDQAPTADEIARIMFPEPQPRTRGLKTNSAPEPQIRTRGIRFTTEEPEATQPQQRWDDNQVASSAASTTPPDRKGSIVGFNITFALNSAELAPAAYTYLDRLGEALRLPAASGKRVRIAGHADASGSRDYNRSLSRERARSVKQYLARAHGIDGNRLEVAGYGEDQPLPGTDPYDGVNRRVEFEPLF